MLILRPDPRPNCLAIAQVLTTLSKSFHGLWPVLVFAGLFLFILSVLTMQLFGTGMDGNSRISFRSFPEALLQSYLVLIGEDWVNIMMQVMDEFGPIARCIA